MGAGWDAQQVALGIARCADRSDIAAMVAHFSETAVVQVGDRTIEGRDALFAFFGGGAAAINPSTERTKHVISNTLVSADGDDLLATSYFQVLRSWGLANWGRYEDRLARVGETWQIVHRKVIVDGHLARPAPPAEAASQSA